MQLLRKLFLGFLGLLLIFFGYICFFDTHPNSFDVGGISSLPLGRVKGSESVLYYNGSDAFSTVMEGDQWKADQFIHMAVKVGKDAYPGVTFYLRQAISSDAQLLIHWRAKGNPGRILIDITDGPQLSSPQKTGENFFVYAETPAEEWSISTFPLAKFERNPVQPAGAPDDGKFDTEGIQAVSFTFFPHSDFTLDVRGISFVWKSRYWFSNALIIIILAVGLLLWWRTADKNIRVPGKRGVIVNAVTARIVFTLLVVALSVAVMDRGMRLYGIAPVFTFAALCGLVLLDDLWKAKWVHHKLWSFRYLAIALAGWYLDFTHNVFFLALLLGIALVPATVQPSRWLLFSTLAIALLALATHPRMNFSTTLAPGAMVITTVGVLAVLVFEIFQHQRAKYETRYVRSLYQDILENTSDSIYLLNQQGVIEAANRGFETLLGRSIDEIVGRNIREFVHREDHRLLGTGEDASVASKPRHYDLRYIDNEGESRIGLVREVPVFEGGFPRGYQAVATDITERKRAETERENLVKDLQSALMEVKTLSGLLPICAACKKVRDDTGYWSQIEAYISARSKAQFTHSICPDCMQKLYPEVLRDPRWSGHKEH